MTRDQAATIIASKLDPDLHGAPHERHRFASSLVIALDALGLLALATTEAQRKFTQPQPNPEPSTAGPIRSDPTAWASQRSRP